jgi:hypothetical protein
MNPAEIGKALGEAQSVQQVLAIVIVMLMGAVVLLARLLWTSLQAHKRELRDLHREHLNTYKSWADALKDGHDGKP